MNKQTTDYKQRHLGKELFEEKLKKNKIKPKHPKGDKKTVAPRKTKPVGSNK